MPRNLSNALLDENNTLHSGDPLLTLLQVTHPDITPIYLVNDNEDIISNGQTYIAYPFRVQLPKEDGESLPTASIQFDNVDRLLVDEIRSIPDAATARMSNVLKSSPDNEEVVYENLQLRNISYNQQAINATLVVHGVLNLRYPADIVNSVTYAGIY